MEPTCKLFSPSLYMVSNTNYPWLYLMFYIGQVQDVQALVYFSGFSITFSTWYWEIAWVSMLLSKVDWICSCLVHQLQVVPQQRFYSSVGKHGVGLTCACMGMSSTSDGPAVDTNLTASGEIRIVPDLSTKCRLPWYCLTSISAWEIHSFLYPFEF